MDTKEKEEDPINQFQKNATYGNASVVLAHIWNSKLVFNDWHQSSKQQDDGDMAMYQKTLNDRGEVTKERQSDENEKFGSDLPGFSL